MDQVRRHVLRGEFITREGRDRFKARNKVLGPPPPWHVGTLQKETCAACKHPCVEACEMNIIRVHGSGHELAGIPFLSFTNGGCSYCHACVDACPMEFAASVAHQVRIGLVILDRQTCLAWKGVLCMSCKFACGRRAIDVDVKSRPAVNAEVCTGCGMCVGVCPKQAITVKSPDGVAEIDQTHRSF